MAISGDNFEVDGLVKQREELERLLMSNPEMEKRVQGLIRKVLLAARRTVAQAAQGKMRSDPRQAYKAVKSSVYRQILGGSVSILNRRRSSGVGSSYEPPRKLREGQRGGNRVPRSQRTQQVMDYEGADRAFVLRFLNAGTSAREAGTRGGRLSGNRGSIAARNFFGTNSQRAMERAAEHLGQLIDDLIRQEFSK